MKQVAGRDLLDFQWTTGSYIAEDRTLQNLRSGNPELDIEYVLKHIESLIHILT